MLSFLLGVLLNFALFYAGFIFNSKAFIMLAFFEGLFLVSSFVSAVVNLRVTKASLLVPISIAEKSSLINIALKLNTRSRIGLKRAKFLIEYGNSMGGKRYKAWIFADAIPYGASEFRYKFKITEAGNYDISLRKIRIYDYLGIFSLRRKVNESTNAMVLPEINGIPVKIGERIRNFYADTDMYDELRPGYDPTKSKGVREYQAGDSLTKVHWKLSAKLDELMINEPGETKSAAVLLLLNLDKSNFSSAIEQAVNMSFSMMDANLPHFICWFSKASNDMLRTMVDSEESFYQFLVTYMQDCVPKAKDEIMARYREKYRGDQSLYEFIFENGNVIKNGNILVEGELDELTLN